MLSRVRGLTMRLYEQLLEREISGVPTHVAVIQDGNRRYARARGADETDGHRAGADTTERVLGWCAELGVEELTLYAFSTENFDRPPKERAALFDLIAEKLRSFADRPEIHDRAVRIRAIGETERLPERVREAITYAENRTADYDAFRLNVALAYGGRAELLGVAREIADEAAAGECTPDEVTVSEIEDRLTTDPARAVDLIIRTGGAERTSNFLPWHANGNEAAVYFCAPYWPAFSRVDFLRAIRTYESRRESWRQTRIERATALVKAASGLDRDDAGRVVGGAPSGDGDAEEPTDPSAG